MNSQIKSYFMQMFLFFMIIYEGACQRAAVVCDRHQGASRFMSAGPFHLGENAWMGERPHVILYLIPKMVRMRVYDPFRQR